VGSGNNYIEVWEFFETEDVVKPITGHQDVITMIKVSTSEKKINISVFRFDDKSMGNKWT